MFSKYDADEIQLAIRTSINLKKKGGAYLRQERVVGYHFIYEEKPFFPLGLLCRVMRVSKSGYYLYARGKSYVLSAPKARVASQVKETFYLHRRRYGARRIAAELRAAGNCIGRAAVRTLMRRQNLRAIQPRRFVPRTTDSRHTIEPSPNLLLELENAARATARRDCWRHYLLTIAVWQMELSGELAGSVLKAHCRMGGGRTD